MHAASKSGETIPNSGRSSNIFHTVRPRIDIEGALTMQRIAFARDRFNQRGFAATVRPQDADVFSSIDT